MEFHPLTPDMLPLCHALCADSIAALPDHAYPLAARLAWAGIWDDETASAWHARLSACWSIGVSAGGELLGFAWLTKPVSSTCCMWHQPCSVAGWHCR